MNFQQLRIIRELTQHNLNLSQTAHARLCCTKIWNAKRP